jgi:adenylate kinase
MQDTEAGVKQSLEHGQLAPSAVVTQLVVEQLVDPNGQYILDGFPRSMENVTDWNAQTQNKYNVEFCVEFTCDRHTLISRMIGRGRDDDNTHNITQRLFVYNKTTMPVIDYYYRKGWLWKINAADKLDQVWHNTKDVFYKMLQPSPIPEEPMLFDMDS